MNELFFRGLVNRHPDKVQEDLLTALSLLNSCWWMMDAEQREMTLRLQERFEIHHGCLDCDWRKELQGEDDE